MCCGIGRAITSGPACQPPRGTLRQVSQWGLASPAVIASALKRIRGGRFLFDLRGFLADEYVDAGVWPAGGTLYRATKKIEAHLIREADGLVVLTRGAGELLSRWYPSAIAGKPVTVIPCCVDMRRFTNQLSAPRPKPGPMVYVGKLGGWYWLDAMLRFYSAAVRLMPELKLAIFTQSDSAPARNCVAAAGLQSSAVSISYVMPDEIPARLAGASGGLSFIRPGPSKSASSPTKLGEYLAAGVPAIANAGIGDVDSMLADRADGPIGVVVDPRSESELGAGAARLRDLLADANMPGRCREAAREHLGLITVGWPRYRALYEQIGCA